MAGGAAGPEAECSCEGERQLRRIPSRNEGDESKGMVKEALIHHGGLVMLADPA